MKLLQLQSIYLLAIISLPTQTQASSLDFNLDLCGPEKEVKLAANQSAVAITLAPMTDLNNFCKLRITAPKTHVIHMQFVDSHVASIRRILMQKNRTETPKSPCHLSIYLPDKPFSPYWKGDPCNNDPLPQLDLLTPDFKLLWSQPFNKKHAPDRKIILTAVGRGAVCKENGQHTCMRIGRSPMLCIPEHLICDGFQNCPKSSTNSDEDEVLCQRHLLSQSALEQLADEIFKTFNHPPLDGAASHQTDSSNQLTFLTWREWQNLQTNSTTAKSTVDRRNTNKVATDSVSQMLSKYGPWGYLMLGLLICGTVLMFCGLWECCFKRPKDPLEGPGLQAPPTAVLIINHADGATTTPQPPHYDDLDQPPSYTTLFPHFKIATATSSSDTTSQEPSPPSVAPPSS